MADAFWDAQGAAAADADVFADWDALEGPYEIVAAALPLAQEAAIVGALRACKYSAQTAIAALQGAEAGAGAEDAGGAEEAFDDWEDLEAPYEVVAEALPKAKEAEIVRALRQANYDADVAIVALQRAKKKPPIRITPASGGGKASPASSLSPPQASPQQPSLQPSAPPPPAAAPEALPALTPAQSAHLAGARPHLSLVTLGHVDAGKSTLLGRLLYDLGLVSDRALSRVVAEAREAKMTAFALAWLFDQGKEERARGVTVDVGVNHFAGARTDFTLLDAPGHREYVPNMICGVAQADAAILVVDATLGAFEAGMGDGTAGSSSSSSSSSSSASAEECGERSLHGGQTREHAHLARALGVAQVVVAVNKLDSCGWSQARYEAIRARMADFLTAGAGFQASRLVFVPLSGRHGINLVHSPAQCLARAGAHGSAGAAERERGEPLTPALADLADFLGHGGGGGGTRSGSVTPSADLDAARTQALALFAQWYKGPTLLECLEALKIPPTHCSRGGPSAAALLPSGGSQSPAPTPAPTPAPASPPLRFLVSDAYAAGSAGEPLVSGRVEGGIVAPGMSITVWPGGVKGKVKSVSRWGAGVPCAGSGDCVDLVLGGLAEAAIGPASVLAWSAAPPSPPCIKLKALLYVLEAAPGHAMPVCRGQQFMLHAHCAAEPCVVSRLLRSVERREPHATRALKPRLLPLGATGIVRIVLARPRCLFTYAENKRLGCFALRYHGTTVAVGRVLRVGR